jgi:hypothetical protein
MNTVVNIKGHKRTEVLSVHERLFPKERQWKWIGRRLNITLINVCKQSIAECMGQKRGLKYHVCVLIAWLLTRNCIRNSNLNLNSPDLKWARNLATLIRINHHDYQNNNHFAPQPASSTETAKIAEVALEHDGKFWHYTHIHTQTQTHTIVTIHSKIFILLNNFLKHNSSAFAHKTR